MTSIAEELCRVAEETNFSGAFAFEKDGFSVAQAFGLKDRANNIPNGMDTRFGIASGTKGFTALGIGKLIEDGKLKFDDSAVKVLDQELAWLPREVTIRHLLGHTSGIGDHVDEDELGDINSFFLDIPVQHLLSPKDYFPLIAKKPPKFSPGERFSYSNSGYIVLSAIIEQVGGKSFPAFIKEHIFDKAGMSRTGFFKSDSLPDDTALGYLNHIEGNRTNLFNLPIIGSGDGGAYSTASDMKKFWDALLKGQIVSEPIVSELLEEKVYVEDEKLSYGLGFWLNCATDEVILEGYDSGVSFRASIRRDGNIWYAILSNTSKGAWPLVRAINKNLQP